MATLLFIDFSKAFDSIYRGKLILLAFHLPKETVITIIKNMKAVVCSLDSDTDFFDIIMGVFLRRYIGTKSIHNQPRFHTMNRSNERKWSHTKKGKK